MQLKVGKTYVDRKGGEWLCVKHDEQIKRFTCKKDRYTCEFTAGGLRCEEVVDDWDLVAEKRLFVEFGKYYRTREGHKAYVAATLPPFQGVDRIYQSLGWIDGFRSVFAWTVDGKYALNDDEQDAYDLIAEWSEPPPEITVDGVIYVRKLS